jgi:hypothetical protein
MSGQHLPTNSLDWRSVILAAALIAVTLLILMVMGRVPICTCGTVKFWYDEALTSETSQHLTDWYSLSHIIHGFLFYGALWFVARNLPVGTRLSIAVAVEAAWEVFENTPFIIERYREVTISLDYYGDSVINSFGDIMAMVVGFLFAWRAPVWFTVLVAIALEALAAVVIHDNLALNIIMLVWPLDVIRQWQMGG